MSVFDKISDVIQKAKGNDESEETEETEDKESDYDESYMKKHMARFMKHNKGGMKKYMGHSKVEKSDSDFNLIDATDSLEEVQDQVEKANQRWEESDNEMVVVEGNELLKAVGDTTEKVLGIHSDSLEVMKAEMGEIREQLDVINRNQEILGEFLYKTNGQNVNRSRPISRQGQTIAKADGDKLNLNSVKGHLLQKAMGGDADAGSLVTELEVARGNVNVLSKERQTQLNRLINDMGGA